MKVFNLYGGPTSWLKLLLLVLIFGLVVVSSEDGSDDPYATLGLSRKATIKDIKHAYKSLAREWHPDKNDSPKAHEKFMAITKAYETLSDPLKKERYDKYGTFDEPSAQFGSFRHPAANPFDDFFGFGFGGFDNGNSFFQRHRISMKMFSHTLLERSFTQPLIVFAYSGYCQLCFRLEPVWQSVVQDLEPLGYGIGTVNAITDGNLLEKLRVSRLPSIVVVVEGRVIHYRGSMHPLSAKSLRVFARDVIPNTFLFKLSNHDGLRRFVDQWRYYNKISVLILGSKEVPRIRYVLTAMKYAQFARFAYINLNDVRNADELIIMRKALAINCVQCENILIFNDFPEKGPVARLTVTNGQLLSVESMGALIESNKHLVLPRLCSQAHFDDLCPVSSRSARKLCVILTVLDTSTDQQYIDQLRDFVSKYDTNSISASPHQRIQFTYMFIDKQKDFMVPFVNGRQFNADDSDQHQAQANKRDIMVIWRLEYNQARFVWLRGIWGDTKESAGEGSSRLKEYLERIMHGEAKLDQQAKLVNMIDEYRPSLFTRIARAAMRMGETAWFHLTKEETLPVLSAVGTFAVILLIGYVLNYATSSVTSSERRARYSSSAQEKRMGDEMNEDGADEQWHPEDPRTNVPKRRRSTGRSSESARQRRIMHEMIPMMHELRAETYFGMIRLLKPGCRSIVVLVDEQSKDTLIPQFARCIWPFRNNKTFSFGYLMVEKNLQWFRKLLEYTIPMESADEDRATTVLDGEDEDQTSDVKQPGTGSGSSSSMYERLKSINPRKTLGTVLVLCGWKLYFNMYHPMHTAAKRKNFIGFDDEDDGGDSEGGESSSDDSDSEKATHEEVQALRKGYQLKLEDVLNGLPNWLDRLFEGSIRRYYIPEWPDNLK